MTPGYQEFEFDLPDALLASLIRAFDGMDGAPLTRENLAGIPDAQGVYQLILGDLVVYVGKTDAQAGLSYRLNRHAWTIQHRLRLEAKDVRFKALRVFVFTAMDLETELIKHYKKAGHVTWNNSGFGSNDPGRNRDHTILKPGSFDALFPIDLDRKITLTLDGKRSVSEILTALRGEVPYTLRFEAGKGEKFHQDLISTFVKIKPGPTTARKVFKQLVGSLPAGWQATQLAGRIILYKESKDDYHGEVIAQS